MNNTPLTDSIYNGDIDNLVASVESIIKYHYDLGIVEPLYLYERDTQLKNEILCMDLHIQRMKGIKVPSNTIFGTFNVHYVGDMKQEVPKGIDIVQYKVSQLVNFMGVIGNQVLPKEPLIVPPTLMTDQVSEFRLIGTVIYHNMA